MINWLNWIRDILINIIVPPRASIGTGVGARSIGSVPGGVRSTGDVALYLESPGKTRSSNSVHSEMRYFCVVGL